MVSALWLGHRWSTNVKKKMGGGQGKIDYVRKTQFFFQDGFSYTGNTAILSLILILPPPRPHRQGSVPLGSGCTRGPLIGRWISILLSWLYYDIKHSILNRFRSSPALLLVQSILLPRKNCHAAWAKRSQESTFKN